MTPVITEAQKKQIMFLFTAFLVILMFTSGIKPLNESIKENETLYGKLEEQQQQMQANVDNVAIETDYNQTRETYRSEFQERFENFKSNEKIEAIALEQNITIASMDIVDFKPIENHIFENYVSQPKTIEELRDTQTDEASIAFPSLLIATVNFTADMNLEQKLQMYDALNNITPVGPGTADMDRYCILSPQMNIRDVVTAGDTRTNRESFSVYVFAMNTLDLTDWDADVELYTKGEEVPALDQVVIERDNLDEDEETE